MIETKHDPSEYIKGIQQLLISDKKRIAFLFGAGTSLAKKNEKSLTVPAIGKMTVDITTKLSATDKKVENAFKEIKKELGDKYNIETILTNLEQKAKIIGSTGRLNDLNEREFVTLIQEIKNEIRDVVSIHRDEKGKPIPRELKKALIQTDFARWIGQAERKFPIEIFTTNYDYLFEIGLENEEIPYYDGFSGSFQPFFNSESVANLYFLPSQTKIWKIHGSLGWHFEEETEKIIRVRPDAEDILIYPSSLKYKDSKKQPYESLMDRLSNYLRQDDSILITCGYSWGDEHINERIISALKTNTTSHVIGLFYDKYWNNMDKKYDYALTQESQQTKIGYSNSKISMYGQRTAIIGCKFGRWQLRTEPSKEDTTNINLYFDEDAYTDLSENINEEKIGEETWSGFGNFKLSDFATLVTFLNKMIQNNFIQQILYGEKK